MPAKAPKPATKAPAKRTTGKSASAPKPSSTAKTVSPAAAKDASISTTNPATLRLKDLVEQVAKTTGAKKPAVKEIVAATLAALGTALAEGAHLNLPPLGKAQVNRTKESGTNEVLIIKLRRGSGQGIGQGEKPKQGGKSKAAAPADAALADSDD